MKYAIYQTKEEAEQALQECNTAFLPTVKEVLNNKEVPNVTQSWAEVAEYEEGWGFVCPSESIWATDSVVENPTPVEIIE